MNYWVERERADRLAARLQEKEKSMGRLAQVWRRRADSIRQGARTALDLELARAGEIHAEELEAEMAASPTAAEKGE